MYRYDFYESPIGRLVPVVDDEALVAIGFTFKGKSWKTGLPKAISDEKLVRDPSACTSIDSWLDDYFALKRVTAHDYFGTIELRGTEFQQSVWNALKEIPYGHTATYGEIAEQIGEPSAIRAVGAANGANPIPILIPCHRVIGSTGKLTGFGGGIERKRALLDLEQGGSLPLFEDSAAQ